MKPRITQARLMEVLVYEPDTGNFFWRVNRGKVRAGTRAATSAGDGYLSTAIDYTDYRHHILAWIYVYGEYPEQQIDHVDGNRSNNAIRNLRLASQSENNQNQRRPRGTNRHGMLGVHFRKDTKKWSAHIGVNGVQHSLGCFSTPEAASAAYIQAKKKYHPYQTIA